MTYQVLIERNAERDLASLSPQLRKRAHARIARLADAPRPPGSRKLAGPSGLWRVRSGDYRIVYSIDDQHAVVRIELVKHRNDAYRHLARIGSHPNNS